MVRGAGFWTATFSAAVVAIFVGFLLLTANPEWREATGVAGSQASAASGEAIRDGYDAAVRAVGAWRVRYGV